MRISMGDGGEEEVGGKECLACGCVQRTNGPSEGEEEEGMPTYGLVVDVSTAGEDASVLQTLLTSQEETCTLRIRSKGQGPSSSSTTVQLCLRCTANFEEILSLRTKLVGKMAAFIPSSRKKDEDEDMELEEVTIMKVEFEDELKILEQEEEKAVGTTTHFQREDKEADAGRGQIEEDKEEEMSAGLTESVYENNRRRRESLPHSSNSNNTIRTTPKQKKKQKSRYSCPKGRKKFKDAWHLNRHLRSKTAHPPSEDAEGLMIPTSWPCGTCDRRFPSRWKLRRHMSTQDHVPSPSAVARFTQLGHKTHNCISCGRNFFYLDDLKKHVQKAHQEKETRITTTRKKNTRVSPDSLKDWFCGTCRKGFYDCWNLRRHLLTRDHVPSPSSADRMKAGAKETLECEACGQIFFFQYDLKIHLQKAHHQGQKTLKKVEVETPIAVFPPPPRVNHGTGDTIISPLDRICLNSTRP